MIRYIGKKWADKQKHQRLHKKLPFALVGNIGVFDKTTNTFAIIRCKNKYTANTSLLFYILHVFLFLLYIILYNLYSIYCPAYHVKLLIINNTIHCICGKKVQRWNVVNLYEVERTGMLCVYSEKNGKWKYPRLWILGYDS